jgi:AcrR family transcriptional regulator
MSTARGTIDRERAVRAAVHLADVGGIGAVTMRAVARELGIEAMSLYHHVANKDDLLDGMVDAVFAEVELPEPGDEWRPAMERRASSLRRALARHRWAVGLMDSRSHPGPATLRHHDAVIRSCRDAGLSVADTAHAVALLDSFVYGFAVQEHGLPFDQGDDVGGGVAADGVSAGRAELADLVATALPDPDRYLALAELARDHVLQPGYSFGDEFDVGLRLVLDALSTAFT